MVEGLFHLAFIGPGGPEFLVVMLVLLMMFGAKDAPRILRKLNEIISQIRNTADGFKREVMYGDLNNDTPAYTSESSDDEFDHDNDYDYEEDYYDDSEDDEDGAAFNEMVEDLESKDCEKSDPELKKKPDEAVSENEDGDAQKT
jgi:Sec-independent protein translocase protein TatA